MSAAAGISTSGGSPNAVVEVQAGMNVQPVVLVDQNGQYVTAPGSVMTTLGDTLYENATPAPARLAGNTSATKEFLTQTGNGTISAAPAWGTIASGDIPASVALTGTPTSPTGTPGDASTQIATDAFVAAAVNAAVQGLSVKPSVQEATAAALPSNVYSNGSSGVGATLTGVSTGVLTVDGIAVSANDRVLAKNEAAPANNGIYVCTLAGAVGVAYVLTRAADMNTASQVPGAFCFTEQGTANAGAGFTVASEGPFTVGTTAITWTQFSGAGEITAGTNLSKSGNTISLATSPALTGTPTAPTASALTNNTQLATTAYADAAVAAAKLLLATINDPLQLGVTGTYTPISGGTPNSVAVSNDAWYVRCISAGYAMSHITVQVGTSSGNACVAAYQSNGSSGAANSPGTQYQTSGSVACPASGSAVIALGGSCTPVLADWMALSADNTTATFLSSVGAATASTLANGFAAYQTSAFPLPAPAVPAGESGLRNYFMRGS